jgi:predicted AAA+ superfamily ATPase
LRRWLTAYAASTATTASFETIREAATAGTGRIVAKSTAIPYRETLERLWLLDPLPPWLPTRNALTRLSQAPRHHLVDPALAARMLGAGKGALLSGDPMGPPIPRDGTLLGALFESLVTLNVRVYAQASEAKVHHLRTWGGDHEVDLIVVRDDQRVVAIEVKLSATVEESDFRHLRWLAGEIGPDLLDSIVITTGTEAYRRADGIAVVPAALLGP